MTIETTVTTVVTRCIPREIVEQILCEHFKVNLADTRFDWSNDYVSEVMLVTTTRETKP